MIPINAGDDNVSFAVHGWAVVSYFERRELLQ